MRHLLRGKLDVPLVVNVLVARRGQLEPDEVRPLRLRHEVERRLEKLVGEEGTRLHFEAARVELVAPLVIHFLELAVLALVWRLVVVVVVCVKGRRAALAQRGRPLRHALHRSRLLGADHLVRLDHIRLLRALLRDGLGRRDDGGLQPFSVIACHRLLELAVDRQHLQLGVGHILLEEVVPLLPHRKVRREPRLARRYGDRAAAALRDELLQHLHPAQDLARLRLEGFGLPVSLADAGVVLRDRLLQRGVLLAQLLDGTHRLPHEDAVEDRLPPQLLVALERMLKRLVRALATALRHLGLRLLLVCLIVLDLLLLPPAQQLRRLQLLVQLFDLRLKLRRREVEQALLDDGLHGLRALRKPQRLDRLLDILRLRAQRHDDR
mmetsp:Transcript_61106/g.181976  ORF Transcript_61106/g.181976 Transcript_61106/m.181976 type:complete len:380 (+) Transcript_61106:616-1755(+)